LFIAYLPYLPPSSVAQSLDAGLKAREKDVPLAALWDPSVSKTLPSFEKVMGFSGMPEIVNGRLAMLGFLAAAGAELSSGEAVMNLRLHVF
jgi:hypothetical protein